MSSHISFGQNTCQNLRKGVFYSYSESYTSESIYYRNEGIQKEVISATGDSTLWQIKWLDNCTYSLKMLSSNSYTDEQIKYIKQHLIVVKILKQTDNYYIFESHFDNLSGRVVLLDTLWFQQKSLKQNDWPIKVYNEKGIKFNLHEDGKWEYAKESEPTHITDTLTGLNNNKFIKEKSATYLVKSKKLNFGVYINPDKWGVTKGGINEPAELNFSMKEYDIFASLITEKTSIPIDNLADLLLQNAQTQTPDVEIIKKEYRIVNGLKLLSLQMRMTIKGMRFVYFSYNFSNENEAVQLTSVTNESLFKKNYQLIENFLNGLTVLK